ncbi:hypothetical protein MKW94_029531 [Papaver nudicaule]|uniref:Uncharacterized protein n=1 Tax=Papaver nudicaule TaxID=74823 RepID=A0AA42AX00_PAPNU|nr:hypothetical protein [Papaver nudicaule]
MAGIALLVDLLKKNPGITSQTFHSTKLFSASIAASAAAASVFGDKPFASRFLFGDGLRSVAFADAGSEWVEDNIPNIRNAAENILQNDSVTYSIKEYPVELKPLFSAFGLRAFGLTTLRSFLMYYLPLLEPRTNREEDEDEDDFLQDAPCEEPTDLVVPFQKSVKQIVREVTSLKLSLFLPHSGYYSLV